MNEINNNDNISISEEERLRSAKAFAKVGLNVGYPPDRIIRELTEICDVPPDKAQSIIETVVAQKIGFDLENSKKWYTDAVESALILRHILREDAQAKMREAQFYEKMERFPYVQLRYNPDAEADEILHGPNLYAGGGQERSE